MTGSLRGKVIAFQDRGSTSAFYIPAYILISKGFDLVELNSFRDLPPENSIGYVFANKEINMSTWVHKGIVTAAAYSNLDWSKDDRNPAAFRKDFIQIYQSQKIPRAIELVRADLPVEVKARLKSILLGMEKDPKAQEVLRRYQKTKKFDELTDDIRTELESLEQILQLVDETLE
ncbi:MAG: phosphate/phosphite/phosphonate ABC transporter substrate-binding protein [Motiliproteus sp.]|nr:phosphate/phosphite/phosphonate ABC transporter substrate-binding protein [Motiliproteus sp.]MCW9053978.1 phosphate/phosphite/phosphonate ABC transporter substrate-binding protein [Motiliproteus sp.]